MRVFVNFPDNITCVICGTNKNSVCILVPIIDTNLETQQGNIVAAVPIHLDCIDLTYDPYSKTLLQKCER